MKNKEKFSLNKEIFSKREKFSPTHPGKIIERRFFKTRNLVVEKVAKDTCLPLYQLQELIEGKRNVDTDIAGRLDRQEAVVKKIIRPYQENKQHEETATLFAFASDLKKLKEVFGTDLEQLKGKRKGQHTFISSSVLIYQYQTNSRERSQRFQERRKQFQQQYDLQQEHLVSTNNLVNNPKIHAFFADLLRNNAEKFAKKPKTAKISLNRLYLLNKFGHDKYLTSNPYISNDYTYSLVGFAEMIHTCSHELSHYIQFIKHGRSSCESDLILSNGRYDKKLAKEHEVFTANIYEMLRRDLELERSVVSYIGSLDSELYEQLKAGLPGSKHEDIGRMCFGCLANGGHGNNSSYSYHAEVELTKGGMIEYAVATTGNKRETCEVPAEGGLLVLGINSTEGGILKIKRRTQNQAISKAVEISEENQETVTPIKYDVSEKESEITLLKAQIQSLGKQVGEAGMNLTQTEVELSSKEEKIKKIDEEISRFQNEKFRLEETIQKLVTKLQEKLEESEKTRQALQKEVNDFQTKLNQLESQKNSELEKNKQLTSELLAEKDKQIKELQDHNNSLTEKIKELEKVIESLQAQFSQEKIVGEKEEITLLQEPSPDDVSLISASSSEKVESEEKLLKEKYPGLARLLREAKGKLDSDHYNSKLKSSHHHQEISETKWKLRNFQSKLKRASLGDLFIRSKELIEKQIKSQKSSSNQTSRISQLVRNQRLSSGESQLKAQQQHVNLPPRKSLQ
ncbi:8407_t:CDS:2 [Ambispora leptoticha]|uniref:8407_t:CDS:1 n=1 Tax=Ambispora leptoticha TaxID=144679 RepID=A0A9N8V4J7_9GLOM|nr:8407_t:CDS:2 [Ambispora leptoticha]